jgi:membrane protease YdiL (CAAX protease family)
MWRLPAIATVWVMFVLWRQNRRASNDGLDDLAGDDRMRLPSADAGDGVCRRLNDVHSVEQFRVPRLLATWVGVTTPVFILAWFVVPTLAPDSPVAALQWFWLLLPVASLMQLALVAWLVSREAGTLDCSTARDRLRLKLPVAPPTKAPSASRFWWTLPYALTLLFTTVLCAAVFSRGFQFFILQSLGAVRLLLSLGLTGPSIIAAASPRPAWASPLELVSPALAGRWLWFLVIFLSWALAAFAEELVFRGLLLPRTARAFGRAQGQANGVLYALYHLHQPWRIPFRLLDSIVILRAARRFDSTWMALALRGGEGIVLAGFLLAATLTPRFATPTTSSVASIARRPPPAHLGGGVLKSLPQELLPGAVDLRGRDLSALDLRSPQALAKVSAAWFDQRTKWPGRERLAAGFDPTQMMDLGRVPGPGVRTLHAEGITGHDVAIGIVDQALLVDHVEYRDALMSYEEMDMGANETAQMHGPAVASIAVGRTVGVAPAARLYYVAVGQLGALRESHNYARGVRRLLEINRQLPLDRRIRVISLSRGWDTIAPGYDEMDLAARQAEAEGVFVVSPNASQRGFPFNGLGRAPAADPERFESYVPGLFWADVFFRAWACRDLRRVPAGTSPRMSAALHEQYVKLTQSLFVPMDARTTASPTGPHEYVFYRGGGWSWSIPYIAGLYALAVQVDPSITPPRFWALVRRTGRMVLLKHEGQEIPFGPIADPPGLIAAVRAHAAR